MVNDTFLSMASTTIHSICNQWQTHKSNTSMFNDSVESVESTDSDVIQQKDELIEVRLFFSSFYVYVFNLFVLLLILSLYLF